MNLNSSSLAFFIPFLTCSVWLQSCDEATENELQQHKNHLRPISEVHLNINDLEIQVDATARISQGVIQTSEPSFGQVNLLSLAGFWVTQDGLDEKYANLIWYYYPESNYTAHWQDSTRGVLQISPGSVDPDTIEWPLSEGFPVYNDGRPALLGDVMLWSALAADTVQGAESFYQHPIPGVQFTQMVWAYSEPDFARSVFFRKTVENQTSQPREGIRISFWADMDLDGSINATGYDSSRALSYTYTPTDSGYTYVAGLTFLEVNGETTPHDLVSSHRIMRKNNYIDPDFGEMVESVDQFIYAARGLSNSGQPMVNPITSEETNYAFTGNPLLGTGWLDVPIDVRSLINGPASTLSSGGHLSATVVITVVAGDDLGEALMLLGQQVDTIRSQSYLWQLDH